MAVGQQVMLKVDAFPDRELKGHVESLQPGTGARFSLLPPENATGNFVKVVQRIPVKIVIDEPAEVIARLAPGMSVQPRVQLAASTR
jgi:membrane fusion protein (multidrug efflux system)